MNEPWAAISAAITVDIDPVPLDAPRIPIMPAEAQQWVL